MRKVRSPSQRGLSEGYRSGLEEANAALLDERKSPYEYETFKIPWEDRKMRKYTPDFLLLKNYIIVETKGRFTSVDRRKHVEIKRQHPALDIRFVFTNSRARLYKGSKTTYGDWCDTHGFKYADTSVPTEWTKEKLNRASKAAVLALKENTNGSK